MTLAPLSNKKLLRDLVTEIAPPTERFTNSQLLPRGRDCVLGRLSVR